MVRTFRHHTVLLILLAAFLILPFLGSRELASSHEARAAINATVVLERGSWGLPRLFDEQVELQKPPLYYWLVSLLGIVRGQVDAWAVRLPAALAALACVGVLVLAAARAGRPAVGLLAGFILVTTLHFTWLAQVGRIDMPLTLTVTIALCSFLVPRAPDTATWPRQLVGHVALGLGVLLKGPIALVLPGVVIAGVMLVERRGPAWRQVLRDGWGVAVVLLVAGPWFIWANLETGGRQLDVFFWRHNVERGLGSDSLAARPWWFYFARFWIDAAPWSALTPVAVVVAWRRGWLRDDPLCRLGLTWFAAMLVFLSCVQFKRGDYLLPAYPGLALFLGAVGQRWLLEQAEGVRRGAWRAGIGVGVACLAGWTTYHLSDREPWRYRDAARQIRTAAGADTPIVFFRTELHPLAYHLGRPMTTVLEWENLAVWASEPRPICFLMPAAAAASWPTELRGPHLQRLLQLERLSEHRSEGTLVLLGNAAAAAVQGVQQARAHP